MRHLPDFTAVRRGRSWVGHSKINDEHFGAAEAYVDRLVEAIGHKDVFFRVLGVRDEVAHQPSVPVNTGYFIPGQDSRPRAWRQRVGLGDEDIALMAERVALREIEHIGRALHVRRTKFCESRLDLQLRAKLVRKGDFGQGEGSTPEGSGEISVGQNCGFVTGSG